MTEERDYGVEPEPEPESGGSGMGGAGSGSSTTIVNPSDENTWSALAHLSFFLTLVTGFMGPVAALVIWLVYRDRSPRVSFHALQSLWYQVAWLVILGVGWTITVFLTLVIIGFLLIPVMLVVSALPFVHMGYAAYKVYHGVDYRYPIVADLVGGSRSIG
ncbi:MAG: DUF4870 domain-containing protein [Rubrobacter sp.]